MSCASSANWYLDASHWNIMPDREFYYQEGRYQDGGDDNKEMNCPKCGAPLNLADDLQGVVRASAALPPLITSTVSAVFNYSSVGGYPGYPYNTGPHNPNFSSGGVKDISIVKCRYCNSSFFVDELRDQIKYDNLRKTLEIEETTEKIKKEIQERLQQEKEEMVKEEMEKAYEDILEDDE